MCVHICVVSTVSAKICDPQREHVTGYIHRFLITSLETHTAVDATDYNRRCNRCPLLSPRITASVILAPSGCCLPPRCASGLGRTGSREAESTTNNRPSIPSIPSVAVASSSRVNERAIACPRQNDTSRRVQNAKASRGAHLVCSLARSRRP